MRTLDHERLEVYQLVRKYNRVLSGMLKRLDITGWSSHVDPLLRAGASMGLNLAEGSGEFGPKEKARFYRIARRSATESAAGLDYLVDVAIAREADIEESRNLLRRIVAILVTLIRRNEPGRASETDETTKPYVKVHVRLRRPASSGPVRLTRAPPSTRLQDPRNAEANSVTQNLQPCRGTCTGPSRVAQARNWCPKPLPGP